MHRAIAYRLVDYDIPIANLDVIQAIGIGAHPGLKLYRRSLAAKIRQGHKISGTTLPTSRKHEFHAHLPFLQLRVPAVQPVSMRTTQHSPDRSTRGSFHHVTRCFLKARLLPLPLYHITFPITPAPVDLQRFLAIGLVLLAIRGLVDCSTVIKTRAA
jgi:hypothetical protein